jgi:hypothetical protein
MLSEAKHPTVPWGPSAFGLDDSNCARVALSILGESQHLLCIGHVFRPGPLPYELDEE